MISVRLRTGALAMVAFFIFSLAFSSYIPSTLASPDESKNRLIVIFDDDAATKDIKDVKTVITQKGGKIKANFDIVNGMVVDLQNYTIENLKTLKGVKEVGFDVKVYASDIELNNSWGVKHIGAGTVHDAGQTGAGINVAVIDTGIDYTHPDLQDNYAGGYDFVNSDSDPMDDNKHGTHVAGIIAAEDNGSGVVGVAPQASLYALKVLDSSGSGYVSSIIQALDWCCENDIQIINMSLGTSSSAVGFQEAINRAYEKGIVIAAAAGNSGKASGTGDNVQYPARYSQVIAVGAVDSSNTRASYSSTGSTLEMAAPGVAVYSCIPGKSYASLSGTSMASPHVAGTAALIMAANPGISNAAVRQLLQDTADDLGASGRDKL